MSSSSRSIAAARQKRAGEQSQQMNTSRPVTSISSQGVFAQQYQQQMLSKSVPVSSKNVRVAQNINQGNGVKNNLGVNQNIQNNQMDQSTKISISNAVGLITLRLGRLETIINDVIDNGGFNANSDSNHHEMNNNMKIVSDEVFENIVNRINLLESKVIQITNHSEKQSKDISELNVLLSNLNTNLVTFVDETNNKFIDYENALAELEKNIVIDPNPSEYLINEEIQTNGENLVNDETLVNSGSDESNETQELHVESENSN
jgi:hypothetical protein